MKSELKSEIGQRVCRMRKYFNLTQEQLAEKLEVSTKHISSVERGLSTLSVPHLAALSEVFHCSLDHLVNGEKTDEISVLQQIPPEVMEVLITGSAKEKELLDDVFKLYIKIIEQK